MNLCTKAFTDFSNPYQVENATQGQKERPRFMAQVPVLHGSPILPFHPSPRSGSCPCSSPSHPPTPTASPGLFLAYHECDLSVFFSFFRLDCVSPSFLVRFDLVAKLRRVFVASLTRETHPQTQ